VISERDQAVLVYQTSYTPFRFIQITSLSLYNTDKRISGINSRILPHIGKNCALSIGWAQIETIEFYEQKCAIPATNCNGHTFTMWIIDFSYPTKDPIQLL